MKLVNPYTGTTVDASGEVAERLKKVGFKPAESPAAEAPKRRPGRPKKS